jgi:hypothetical protein
MSLDVYLEANKCPHCGRAEGGFHANITHNLAPMAREAGIYRVVWLPDKNDVTTAQQLIGPLRRAIAEMKADPARFEKHNAENGWGLYKNFLPWLEKYLQACEDMPEASVRVSR